jgi:hypothetical protein
VDDDVDDLLAEYAANAARAEDNKFAAERAMLLDARIRYWRAATPQGEASHV